MHFEGLVSCFILSSCIVHCPFNTLDPSFIYILKSTRVRPSNRTSIEYDCGGANLTIDVDPSDFL